MHLIEQLQNEETPVDRPKFDGDVTDHNRSRTLHQVCQEFVDANPSCVDGVFTGVEMNSIACQRCRYVSDTYKPFQVLSLIQQPTLDQCLNHFHEAKEHDEWQCAKCP